MKRLLILLTLFNGAAHAADINMYFSCSGVIDGASFVLLSRSYLNGEWRGLSIDRKAIYEEDLDQRVDSATVMTKQPFTSQNPRLQGFERYSFDLSSDRGSLKPVFDWKTGKKLQTFDASKYEFILPPKSELEKIWRRPDEPEENGTFEIILQLKRKNSEQALSGKLRCLLNWKI